MSRLPQIPYIDLRGTTPARLVQDNPDAAHRLLSTITAMHGALARWTNTLMFPLTDMITKRWLKRTNNPYRDEIDTMHKTLNRSGVHTLNLCYEWACTTSIVDTTNGPVMTRVLDWPFPNMGTSMVVTRQSGPAGEFDNVTWPGMAGVFNAVAKGRFTAALNQAPRRRHRMTKAGDWLKNRHLFTSMTGLPPAHLLRKTFEEARTYDEARDMLAKTPVSIPTIFTLAGTRAGEGCIIERTETHAIIRDMKNGRVSATNHFQSGIATHARWEPRRPCTFPRAAAGSAIDVKDINAQFDWFVAPIANEYSRLAMNAGAATGRLELIGTEGTARSTQVFIKPQ